jgi:hypothetical protein
MSKLCLAITLSFIGCRGGVLPLPEGDGGTHGGDAASVDGASACGAITDEAACDANPACFAFACPTCGGGTSYAGCYDKKPTSGSGAGSPCPAIHCPAEPACAGLAQSACDQSPVCHSLFGEGNQCGCAVAGCCMQFLGCAEGKKANCEAQVACTIPSPVCGGDYVPSYANACYEGCVRKSECQ